MLLLSILGYILLVLVIILLVIIFIPYDYNASGEKSTELELRGSISWFFGGIKLTFAHKSKQDKKMTLNILGITKKLNLLEKSKEKQDRTNAKQGHTKPAKNKKSFDSGSYLRRDVIQKAFSLLSKILKHCRPETLSIHARVGFNDPMYTGFVCALNSQLCFVVNQYDLDIQPVFDEEVLEGRFSIGGRIWLPYLILVVIGFLLSKPIRNILLTKIKRKNKGGPQYVR